MGNILRVGSQRVIGREENHEVMRGCVMSGLFVRFFLFFIIPCTSSVLLSEHCGNTPRAREKWVVMMVLESAHILWVVI